LILCEEAACGIINHCRFVRIEKLHRVTLSAHIIIIMASFLAATARLGAQYSTPALAIVAAASSSSLENTATTTNCESSKQQRSTRYQRRRMTAVGRFSLLSETESNPSIPVMVLTMSGKAWTPQDFIKMYFDRKISEKHERFRAFLDPNDWTHFLTSPAQQHTPPKVQEALSYPVMYRTELKDWITDAIMQPIPLSESLWQARTATGGVIGQSGAISKQHAAQILADNPQAGVESLLLFRAHHCMADGVSLGAIFGDFMDEGAEFQELIAQKVKGFKKRKKSWWKRMQRLVFYWWWGSIRAFGYQFYLYVQSWITSDPWKLLLQAHVEAQFSQPRTLSWVQVASVSEVKEVAAFFSQHTKGSKVTVNDIFCSCITAATAKLMAYHQNRHPDLRLTLPYMNIVIPVHMQGGILLPGQSMGNKIGAMVNRVPAEAASDPQDRLEQVHNALWKCKQTPAAVWSFLVAKTFGGIGNRLGGLTPWLFEKAHANASVVVTNVRGPEKKVHLDGRRVEGSLGFLPLPPGIPIGMVVHSYANRITLSVIAKSWAVPDADLFLSWVVEEYQSLLQQATEEARTAEKKL
jgi:hypothetical protein